VITLLVPGVLRGDVEGAAQLHVDVAVRTLGDLLDEVARRWPRLHRRICDERGEIRRYVNVYIDDEDCRRLAGRASPVADGAEIQVLPSVAGGSLMSRDEPAA
jgi:molybdopterin synthase sulfur carrier subunit